MVLPVRDVGCGTLEATVTLFLAYISVGAFVSLGCRAFLLTKACCVYVAACCAFFYCCMFVTIVPCDHVKHFPCGPSLSALFCLYKGCCGALFSIVTCFVTGTENFYS